MCPPASCSRTDGRAVATTSRPPRVDHVPARARNAIRSPPAQWMSSTSQALGRSPASASRASSHAAKRASRSGAVAGATGGGQIVSSTSVGDHLGAGRTHARPLQAPGAAQRAPSRGSPRRSHGARRAAAGSPARPDRSRPHGPERAGPARRPPLHDSRTRPTAGSCRHPAARRSPRSLRTALRGRSQRCLEPRSSSSPRPSRGARSAPSASSRERSGRRPITRQARDGLGLALEVERTHRLEFDRFRRAQAGELADEHRSRLGRGLESGREVDRVAGHPPGVGSAFGRYDLARVHPDPQPKAASPPSSGLQPQPCAQQLDRPDQRQPRPDGPLCVVVAGARHAEHGHRRVTDELLQHPAVPATVSRTAAKYAS